MTATSATGQALSGGGTWTFTTVPAPRTDGVCPCSLYQDSVTPGGPEFNDGVPLTLGVRFASDSPGQVTGIRYYKSAGNTGTHTGGLYTAAGQQLATVTFTGESSSGWQTAAFSQPVDIAADTEYVAAYRTPTGVYSASTGRLWLRHHQRTAAHGTRLRGVHLQRRLPVILLDRKLPRGRRLRRDGAASQRDSPGAGSRFPRLPGGIPKPSVTLSAPIQAGFTFDLSANGAAVAGPSALSADGRTITFSPAEPLPAATVIIRQRQ